MRNVSDEDSDSQDALCSLFSDELEDNSSDTKSHSDCKSLNEIHKSDNDDVIENYQRLNTEDADMSIVIDDESIMNMFLKCEKKECQSHDKKMLLFIASLKHSDDDVDSCDEVNSSTAKHFSSNKHKCDSESEISSFNMKESCLAVFSDHDDSDQTQSFDTEIYHNISHHSDETQSDVVWEYHDLHEYKTVDEKLFVLIIWCST